MRHLVVGGAWTACGKTSTVELLLRVFPGWGAIKLTPTRPDESCPLGTDCGACHGLSVPFELYQDPERLAVPRKDTWRFLQAGAGKVVWVRSRPEALREALDVAWQTMSGLEGVLIESTSGIPLCEGPSVVVTRPRQPMVKDSARAAAGHVDLLAVNGPIEGVGEGEAHPLGALLRPRRVVAYCAAAAADAAVNRDFVAACRQLLGSAF